MADVKVPMEQPTGVPVEGLQKEEKTLFDVVLKQAGSHPLDVIKALKDITGMGLAEIKDLVDGAPMTIVYDVSKEKAEDIATKLREAGAEVEIR